MADTFTTEAFTLLAIGLAFIMLRTYARISKIGMAGFKPDDYLMLAAAVVYTAETVLAYSVGAYWHGLANNGMTDAERQALDPSSDEYRIRVNGSKTQIAGWSTYTLLLWLLKASMCSFYLRLTEGLDYRNRIMIGFVLIATTWLAVFLSIILGCRTFSKNWQIYPDPGNACQPAISHIDIFVTVVLNVLTDIYLMSIPLPMLWTASLRPLKKVGLMLLFSGGIFVTMAGILRCVLILTNPITGAQQAGSWACRETFVAVITSNAPMIFPLVKHWTRPVLSSVRSGLASKQHTSATHNSHGMIILEDKNPRRGLGPKSVNPLPNMTYSESQEAINEGGPGQNQQSQITNEIQAQTQNKRGSHHDDIDIERQVGITKKVEMYIQEEDRSGNNDGRRRRHSGSDGSRSLDSIDAIPGARRGDYFLTRLSHPQHSASKSSNGSGGPSPTMASPLTTHAWDGNTASSPVQDAKHSVSRP